MNCRDPTATPSAMLPLITAEVSAMLRTSPILRVGALIQIIHVVSDFRFQWVPLCSDSGVSDVEVLQKRQHQDWVTGQAAHLR